MIRTSLAWFIIEYSIMECYSNKAIIENHSKTLTIKSYSNKASLTIYSDTRLNKGHTKFTKFMSFLQTVDEELIPSIAPSNHRPLNCHWGILFLERNCEQSTSCAKYLEVPPPSYLQRMWKMKAIGRSSYQQTENSNKNHSLPLSP